MTPEKAEAIYNKVIKEKEKISVVDISEDKEELHNGIDPRVAEFLAQYQKDSKSCMREFTQLNTKAQELLKEVKLG